MKQPINLLLYTATVGMLGAAGYEFYRAVPNFGGTKPLQEGHIEGAKVGGEILQMARSSDGGNPAWDYLRPYWNHFATANFTGKLPPKPVVDTQPGPVTPPPQPSEKPLHEIISLVGLIHSGGDDPSMIQVRYKEGSGVQIPPEFQPGAAMDSTFGGASPGAGVAAMRPNGGTGQPRGRRGRNTQPAADPARQAPPSAVPTLGGAAEVVQRLQPGDTLWEPFEHVVFKRVADDAFSAFFVRKTDTGESDEEELFRGQQEFDHEALEKLAKLFRDGSGSSRGSDGSGTAGGAPATPRDSAWFDSEDTVIIDGRPNERVVGRKDSQMFRENPDRIFEQVNLQPYTLSTGAYKGRTGLQVANVDSQLASRFGVHQGDIIISVNGQPVTSKAAAISHGQREYDRGVRVFRVEVLSYGVAETRVYHAEDQ